MTLGEFLQVAYFGSSLCRKRDVPGSLSPVKGAAIQMMDAEKVVEGTIAAALTQYLRPSQLSEQYAAVQHHD